MIWQIAIHQYHKTARQNAFVLASSNIIQVMGAAQNQGTYSEITLGHPFLRNCRALTKNNLTFLQTSMPIQRAQIEEWKEEITAIKGADTESLLLPLKHKYEDGGVCSTAGEVTLQYDFYPKLLSTEITDRSKQQRRFSEAQLWYLLYVLVSARQALLFYGKTIGDLQPRNIFLNSQQLAKVACLLSWPGQVSTYRRAVREQEFGFLAPQDIQRLQLGAMDNKGNSQAQIFAMGLTLLSASSLQPMNDLYNLHHKSFDQQLFSSRLAVFQQNRGYSDIYRAVVTNLLEFDPLKRMNQEDLQQLLYKHNENLVNKRPLLIDNVGKKLQQSINVLVRVGGQEPVPQNSKNTIQDSSALYGDNRRQVNQSGQLKSQSIQMNQLQSEHQFQKSIPRVDSNLKPKKQQVEPSVNMRPRRQSMAKNSRQSDNTIKNLANYQIPSEINPRRSISPRQRSNHILAANPINSVYTHQVRPNSPPPPPPFSNQMPAISPHMQPYPPQVPPYHGQIPQFPPQRQQFANQINPHPIKMPIHPQIPGDQFSLQKPILRPSPTGHNQPLSLQKSPYPPPKTQQLPSHPPAHQLPPNSSQFVQRPPSVIKFAANPNSNVRGNVLSREKAAAGTNLPKYKPFEAMNVVNWTDKAPQPQEVREIRFTNKESNQIAKSLERKVHNADINLENDSRRRETAPVQNEQKSIVGQLEVLLSTRKGQLSGVEMCSVQRKESKSSIPSAENLLQNSKQSLLIAQKQGIQKREEPKEVKLPNEVRFYPRNTEANTKQLQLDSIAIQSINQKEIKHNSVSTPQFNQVTPLPERNQNTQKQHRITLQSGQSINSIPIYSSQQLLLQQKKPSNQTVQAQNQAAKVVNPEYAITSQKYALTNTSKQPVNYPIRQYVKQYIKQYITEPIVAESAKNTNTQTTRQLVRQKFNQCITESNKTPVLQAKRQEIRQNIRPVVIQPIKQTVPQPVKQTAKQPSKQLAKQFILKQTTEQPAKQPVQQIQAETVTQTNSKQTVQLPASPPLIEIIAQTFNNTPNKQSLSQSNKHSNTEILRQPIKQDIQQPAKQIIKEVKQIHKEPVKQINKQSIKQTINQPEQQINKQFIKQTNNYQVNQVQPIKQVNRQTINQTSKQLIKQTNIEPSKQITKQITQQPINQSKKQEISQTQKQVQQITNKPSLSPLIKVWGVQKTKQSPALTQKSNVNQLNNNPAPQQPAPQTILPISLENQPLPEKTPSEHSSTLKERKAQNQYILIQQTSRVTQTENELTLQQRQNIDTQENPSDLASARIQHDDEEAAPEQQSQITKLQEGQSQASIDPKYLYLYTATQGSFEQCWNQLQKMLSSPADYCSKVDPSKVDPRDTEYGRFLKIGPGRVKVQDNKEQGKVWLRNLQGSDCEGQLFCGVVKGLDKQHYLWFTSSYTYRGEYFPSKEVLEEALEVARTNLQLRHQENNE